MTFLIEPDSLAMSVGEDVERTTALAIEKAV
jgi:hypothetical protein